MPSREWELVPGGSSRINEGALTMKLCSNVKNTEQSIIRWRTKLAGGIREVRGRSWLKDFETERRNRVISSLRDRKSAQTLKERGDMFKFGTAQDKSSSMVLNFVKFFNEVFYNELPSFLSESREPRGVEEAGCKIYSGAPTVSQTTG